jgi:hypothetical protein
VSGDLISVDARTMEIADALLEAGSALACGAEEFSEAAAQLLRGEHVDLDHALFCRAFLNEAQADWHRALIMAGGHLAERGVV